MKTATKGGWGGGDPRFAKGKKKRAAFNQKKKDE